MDEALLLLIQANAQQARDAGAAATAEILEKLVRNMLLTRDALLFYQLENAHQIP